MSIRESYLYFLWTMICIAYEDSAVHRLLAAAGSWCNRRIDESLLLGVLCREGRIARAWSESLLCRGLTAVVNVPARLLHRLYRTFQTVFDTSFFAGLAFEIGEETAITESWLIMLLWVIPFDYWNNAYSLLGFGALLVLFYAGTMRNADLRLNVKALGPYTVGMFAAAAFGVVLSAYPDLSARFLTYHVICLLCVLITVSSVRNSEDLKRLAAGAGFAVLVSSAYAAWQRVQGVKVNASYVDLTVNEGMPGRVDSFFDNPNTFAEMLIMLLPLVLALVLCSKHKRSKLAAAAVTLAGVTALGMTYSRASWVGFAVSLAVLTFLWKPKLIPAFAVVCILAVPLLPTTIINRILTITNTSDTSTASRIPLYEAALSTIRRSPITGAGLGTAAVKAYVTDNNLYFAKAPFVHAHNIYLQVWVEMGLLGIVSFVGAVLLNIKNAARTVRHCPDSAARTITCAGAAALCGCMVCGLADYLWNYPRVMSIFWFLFALTIAGTKLCAAERQKAANE